MSREDDNRLVLALALVKTLAGGLDQSRGSINWGLVHQVFKYKFEPATCRKRWEAIKYRYFTTLTRLQQQVRKLLLQAYESEDIPTIDLAFPEKVEWAELVQWVEANLDDDEPGMPSLPDTRDEFDEDYEIETLNEVYQPDMDEFYSGTSMQSRRDEMVREMSFVVSVKGALQSIDERMFLKSWVRAEALSRYANLEGEPIVNSEPYDDLKGQIAEELMVAKFFRRETTGRRKGSTRIYKPTEFMMTTTNRTWNVDRFVEVAAIKLQVDSAFKRDGKLNIDYLASDATNLVVQNLASEGRAMIVPVLPEVNHDFDAPFPKLSKWGLTDANYKTVQMDKERLHFELELVPSDSYIYGNPLPAVEIPLTRQYGQEPGPRLPFWTSTSGVLIKDNWNNLLASVLFLLATRSGIKAEGLSKAHKDCIWSWEFEIMLGWAEKVGLARRLDGDSGGWTTGEWWWMAMGDRSDEQEQLHE